MRLLEIFGRENFKELLSSFRDDREAVPTQRMKRRSFGPMGMTPIFALFVVLCFSSPTLAASPDPQRGREFAQTNCARCHSIDRTGSSPRYPAPPFRELHNRYPVEALEESLAEGIVTGHVDMPEFQLSPDQIDDLIAFLKTLE